MRDVGDIVVGSVLGASSQRANECRIAMFRGISKGGAVKDDESTVFVRFAGVRGRRGGDQGGILRHGHRRRGGDDDGESDEVGGWI